jgi:hypothetical protein
MLGTQECWTPGILGRRGIPGPSSSRRYKSFQGAAPVATYKMIYGDDEIVADETLEDIDSIEHEDGWVVLFRGDDAILRVQEDHVQSLELVGSVD